MSNVHNFRTRRCRLRGDLPWRDKPTDREKVIYERFAEKIEEATGWIVDPQSIRAVRYILRHSNQRNIFGSDSELQRLTEVAKLKRNRDRAVRLLRQAEEELSAFLEDDDDWAEYA